MIFQGLLTIECTFELQDNWNLMGTSTLIQQFWER